MFPEKKKKKTPRDGNSPGEVALHLQGVFPVSGLDGDGFQQQFCKQRGLFVTFTG